MSQCFLTVCHWNFGRRKGNIFSSKEQKKTFNQSIMFCRNPLDLSLMIIYSVPSILHNSLGDIKRKERKSLTVRLRECRIRERTVWDRCNWIMNKVKKRKQNKTKRQWVTKERIQHFRWLNLCVRGTETNIRHLFSACFLSCKRHNSSYLSHFLCVWWKYMTWNLPL